MKCGIFSIQDKLVGFKNPFLEINKEVATRNFQLGVEMEYHGEIHSPIFDQALYHIGNFDSETGLIEAFDSPVFVTSGILVIPTLNRGVVDENEN